MNNLYVVGNGFDLAHGLKTAYWDFRCYLDRYAQDFLVELEKMYGIYPIDEEDWRIQKQLKQIKIKREEQLKQVLWKNFEKDLASIDETRMLDWSSSVVDSLDLESGLIGIEDTLNDYWEREYSFIVELQKYLYKWARQIRLFKAQPKKNVLLGNREDYFLTFNYTSTLERIYRVNSSNVAHIHGGLPPYCSIEPVIGHGDKKKIEYNRELADDADNRSDEAQSSIYNAIANYYERTLKNTDRYILLNKSFLTKLDSVKTVYVIGHSLGSVDYPYFRFVRSQISSDAHWIVFFHSPEEKNSLEKALKEIGLNQDRYSLEPSSEFWD